MDTKQLNVWISAELRDYIAERAEAESCGMNKIISELVSNDMARRKGDFIQQNTLAVLQEMITAEIHRTHAQLRQDLREDRAEEAQSLREFLQKHVAHRLAGLTVHAIKNGGIARRLLYTLLAKTHGWQFAQEAYERAEKKAQEELVPRKTKAQAEEYTLFEEGPEAVEEKNHHA